MVFVCERSVPAKRPTHLRFNPKHEPLIASCLMRQYGHLDLATWFQPSRRGCWLGQPDHRLRRCVIVTLQLWSCSSSSSQLYYKVVVWFSNASNLRMIRCGVAWALAP